jgi:hypothetical protein
MINTASYFGTDATFRNEQKHKSILTGIKLHVEMLKATVIHDSMGIKITDIQFKHL